MRRNLLIRASAGSGKTTRLVGRLISLLADGVEPGEIVALTFTRKAAAEFRRRLLAVLARAARDGNASAPLAGQAGLEKLSTDDYLHLLGNVVQSGERLKLATIDAFFHRLLRLFRFDLGIGEQIEMMPEGAEADRRHELLAQLVSDDSGLSAETLVELLSGAGWDDTQRRFQDSYDQWIESGLSLYRSAPLEEVWGKLPAGVELADKPLMAWRSALNTFLEGIDRAEIEEDSRELYRQEFERLREWDGGPLLPGKRAAAWIESAATDPHKMVTGKKYFAPRGYARLILTPEMGAALVQMARLAEGARVRIKAEISRMAYRLIALYEAVLMNSIYAQGEVSFEDISILLRGFGEVGRDIFGYRLDGMVHHWLLDEFQDTSRLQWGILERTIDEVFTDENGERSFFCVGDPKQSIYGWRGGDARLFSELAGRYRVPSARALEEESQAGSYRCRPAVIEMVNQVFGLASGVPHTFPAGALQRWQKDWETHVSLNKDEAGFAEVSIYKDAAARDQWINENLLLGRPWERGESTAILFRRNRDADALASLLAENNIPVIRDGKIIPCRDFSVGRRVLSVVRLAHSPADGTSCGHLEASDWGAILKDWAGESDQWSKNFRKLWYDLGPRRFLLDLRQRLRTVTSEDDLRRMDLLRPYFEEAAARGESPGWLARRLTSAGLREEGNAAAVQLMTVHAAKGLEFDNVYLGALELWPMVNLPRGFWTLEDSPGKPALVFEAVRQDRKSVV